LKLEEGYWILTLSDETITVCLKSSATTYTISLSQGWNMISGIAGSADFTNPQDNPDGAVLPPAFWWNPATFGYESKSTIEPCKGYWVLALEACTLTLTISPPASPSASTSMQPLLAGNREPTFTFPPGFLINSSREISSKYRFTTSRERE